MRFVKFLGVFGLVLGLSQSAFAATADWAEEMDVLPGASDKAWFNFEGDWIPTVTQGPGTWLNDVNDGNMGSGNNPTIGQQQWTIEYKFRIMDALPTSGLIIPVWFYNSGSTTQSGNLARVRMWMAYHGGGADAWFEVPGAEPAGNRYQYASIDLGDSGPNSYWNDSIGEWHTVRTIFDDLAATPYMSLYIDGEHIATVDNGGGSLMDGQDDPGIMMGAQDGGKYIPVEWDYLRVALSVVPNGEPLNAVPEPSTLSLLGLAGLALMFRRRH